MTAMVVNAGKAIIAGRMIGATPSQGEPKFLGVGTSSTAEAASQTDLQAPAPEGRVSCTSSQVTVNVTNDSARWTGTVSFVTSETIQEVALFDAVTSGNMFIRAVITAQPVLPTDTLAVTVTVTNN